MKENRRKEREGKGQCKSEKDLYDVEIEISAVSAILTGLSYQLDEDGSMKLNDENFMLALHGVSDYLDRIAESITEMDKRYLLIEREKVHEV